MRRVLRIVGRILTWPIPARYRSRRDRLSPEADQLASMHSWRSQF